MFSKWVLQLLYIVVVINIQTYFRIVCIVEFKTIIEKWVAKVDPVYIVPFSYMGALDIGYFSFFVFNFPRPGSRGQ